MLNIVVHQNIIFLDVIFPDILNSDHLPIVFHILDHVRTKNLSNPTEKFTDWERFLNIACDLILPRIEINSEEDVSNAARDFTAS
jgi:hypothetical protein